MTSSREVKCFKQRVNDIDFYCELRGSGPTVAFVPAGEGDCASFAKVADMLSDEFTVLLFDMRGMSRTGMPKSNEPWTPKDLGSDVAGLIKALDIAPASIWGCSSGGQAVLGVGQYYPEVARNIMVHEAALQHDTPIPGVGKENMKEWLSTIGFSGMLRDAVGNDEAWLALGPEYHERIAKNGQVWLDFIFLTAVDQTVYSAETLAAMPPLTWSVGAFSRAWVVEMNLRVARRANAEVVWMPCMHYPQVTVPELLTQYVREQTRKHL